MVTHSKGFKLLYYSYSLCSDDNMLVFCSTYSFSVSIPSSNKFCKYLNCSRFFILSSTVFPGDIPVAADIEVSTRDTVGACGEAPDYFSAFANVIAAPVIVSPSDSFLGLLVLLRKAGMSGGLSVLLCKPALTILDHNLSCGSEY